MCLILQNRVWQRDSRDIPIILPDATYFNEVRQNQIFLPLHLSFMSRPSHFAQLQYAKCEKEVLKDFIVCMTLVVERVGGKAGGLSRDNIHMINLLGLPFCSVLTHLAVMKRTAWEQGKSIF